MGGMGREWIYIPYGIEEPDKIVFKFMWRKVQKLPRKLENRIAYICHTVRVSNYLGNGLKESGN